MGYLIALEDAEAPALMAAVRSYLCGRVEEHDGRFLPTSAELARVVRAEQARIYRSAPPLLQIVAPEPTDEERARWAEADREHRARMAAKFKALSERLGGGE